MPPSHYGESHTGKWILLGLVTVGVLVALGIGIPALVFGIQSNNHIHDTKSTSTALRRAQADIEQLKALLEDMSSALQAGNGNGNGPKPSDPATPSASVSRSRTPSTSHVPGSPSSSRPPSASPYPTNCPVGGLSALCATTSRLVSDVNTLYLSADEAAACCAENSADIDELFDEAAVAASCCANSTNRIDQLNSTVITIVNGSAADYQYPTHRTLLPCRDVLRMANDIVNARYYNITSKTLDVPLDDWTGGSVLDRFVLPPLVTLVPANQTANEFFEAIVALSMRAYIQCIPTGRSMFGQDDAQDAGRLHDEHTPEVFGGFVRLMRKIANDVTPDYTFFGQNLTLDRLLATRLATDMFVSMTEWFGNPDLMTEQITFSQYYSGNKHRYVNQVLHWDIFQSAYVSWVPEIWGIQGLTMYWPRTLPLSFWSATEKEALFIAPEAVAASSRLWSLAADNERAAIDNYFNPIYFLDPNQAVIFLNATDPEGLARQSDQTATLWIGQGNQLELRFWKPPVPNNGGSFLTNFKSLQVSDDSGNPLLTYGGGPNSLIYYNFPEVLTYHFGAEQAAQLTDKWAYVWDNKVLPEVKRFSSAVVDRMTPAHMSNDHYTGHWRGGHRYVSLVERNATSGRATAYRVPYNDANPTGPQLRIPLDASQNAAFAALQAPALSTTTAALVARFTAAQSRIAGLERWIASDLENAVAAHVGDAYLVLLKNNRSLGISAGNPYTNVQQIITNFVAQENVVQPYGSSGDIVDLVSRSGEELAELFFDIRELLADELVKERYATFGFASSATAGLYKLNTTGANITLELVQAYSQESAVKDAKSDIDCLGRHYGYTVTGAINASEPDAPANYVFHNCMDYIYRQHYAIDNTLPLTPSNIYDPVTGKPKYQYTDVGDGTRRAAFLLAFRTLEATTGAQLQTKRGTYMRFKVDYLFQVLARYVVNTAVANNLLSQSFNDEYFNSTVITTFDPATIAATGPERVVYRVRGQLSGSANSGTGIDLQRKFVNITIAFTTVIPFVATSELGTMLHEGALGHGFDRVPNLVDFLRGIVPVTGWPTTASSPGILDDGVASYNMPVPASASLGEGWATLGEVIGMINKYYVIFDESGKPIPGSQDTVAALNAIISLSRIAARQYCAMGINFARNGWTFNKLVTTFKKQTGFSTQTAINFVDRFYLHPMQQTSYANGFISNVGLISFISNFLAAECYCFDMSKFVEFRITRTDYIAGASLFEIATQNIYTFRTDDLLPCPDAPPCAKKRRVDDDESPALVIHARGTRSWKPEHIKPKPEHKVVDFDTLLPIKKRKIDPSKYVLREFEHDI